MDLPDRLGGGFLFAVGIHIWRADRWLGQALPIFTATAASGQILVGLDRAYIRYPQGSLAAFDPRTGAPLDLGSLPATPHLGRLAAVDAWRALAIADLRGALITVDAGTSWRPVPLPIEPLDVAPLDDGVAVGGRDKNDRTQWWMVQFDGHAEPLPASPPRLPAVAGAAGAVDTTAGVFGPHPLATALADGWPLVDGTAVVARDGALARIRLSDGALVEVVTDAFSLKPARCHPLALETFRDRAAFGFVCGAPQGETRIYAWDPAGSRVIERRRFGEPRQVLAFGNGTLAVRGSCEKDDGGANADTDERPWCLMSRDGDWSEMRVRGAGADRARLVMLADGSTAILRPPVNGDLSTARLTRVDRARQTDSPIHLPLLRADVARALRFGVWMDGFEERRPGVLGGWVEAAGSVVGLEIAVGGDVRVGEYIRDAGGPIVSGLWGFGWTASRGGFETTDGGMTWVKEIALPEPIADPAAGRQRACGPLGCLVAGWLRIGWGAPAAVPAPQPPAAHPVASASTSSRIALRLQCEPLPPSARRPTFDRAVVEGSPSGPPPAGARSLSSRTAASAAWGSVAEFPPFAGVAGPPIPTGDVGFAVDAANGFEHTLRAAALGRVYAWGPGTGEWEALGRWQVVWTSPWAGLEGVRTSGLAPAPWMALDTARRGLGIGPAVPTAWAIASGDDADHALLVARYGQRPPSAQVWSLESGRAPVEIHPPDSDTFAELQAATRIGGRWVLATSERPSETAAAVLWQVDGAIAQEVGRVARVGFEGGAWLRLARRRDRRAIGLAVEGQPDIARPPSIWVTGWDLDTGAMGEPVRLAPLEVSSHTLVASVCSGDDSGWELELPYWRPIEVYVGDESPLTLRGPTTRMRVSPEQGCLEDIAGAADAGAAFQDAIHSLGAPLLRSAPPGSARRGIETSVFFPGARLALRCRQR